MFYVEARFGTLALEMLTSQKKGWWDIWVCFLKWWYPQIIHFNRGFHYITIHFGIPPFLETSIYVDIPFFLRWMHLHDDLQLVLLNLVELGAGTCKLGQSNINSNSHALLHKMSFEFHSL